MKTRHIFSTILFLAVVGGFLAWRYWPRTVPLWECSEVYRRYADSEHVAAAFLKDFRVNDTVCVDVTLLEARDSLGWERMSEGFSLPPPEMFEEMEYPRYPWRLSL